MYRLFREYLEKATGQSRFVIVVVADIRGFSAFSRVRESPDTAMYIKRVYIHLLDNYFPQASFYKPTGDGLLLTIPYDENTLVDAARGTVESILRCVSEFGSICSGDHMINFPTPTQIGFGLARGTACCLASGDNVLDYSGHLLNLTSRLMNLARPYGVVIDGGFGIDLLAPETRERFSTATVFLKGLAEDEPISVFYLKDAVEIPLEAMSPAQKDSWQDWKKIATLAEWKDLAPHYRIDLADFLKETKTVEVCVKSPAMRNHKVIASAQTIRLHKAWSYETGGGQPRIVVNIAEVLKQLGKEGVPQSAKITLSVRYIAASSRGEDKGTSQ